MNFFKRLLGKKEDHPERIKEKEIGGVSYPQILSKRISDYLEECPEWIGDVNRWGYGKEDAFLMACDNSVIAIRNEYTFARLRSAIEVNEILGKVFDRMERTEQHLVEDGKNSYDVLRLKVYYFSTEDVAFLKNDLEKHNGYKDDKDGFGHHMHLRDERVKFYFTECWININSFFKA